MQDVLIVLMLDGLVLAVVGIYLVRIYRAVSEIKKSVKRSLPIEK